MPKLLLQPLVENAVVHNTDKVAYLHVKITGESNGREMVLTVSDNGAGMAEEERRQVLHRVEEGKSIGLSLVDRMFKLRFGADQGSTLQSKLGEGPKEIVVIPAKEDSG